MPLTSGSRSAMVRARRGLARRQQVNSGIVSTLHKGLSGLLKRRKVTVVDGLGTLTPSGAVLLGATLTGKAVTSVRFGATLTAGPRVRRRAHRHLRPDDQQRRRGTAGAGGGDRRRCDRAPNSPRSTPIWVFAPPCWRPSARCLAGPRDPHRHTATVQRPRRSPSAGRISTLRRGSADPSKSPTRGSWFRSRPPRVRGRSRLTRFWCSIGRNPDNKGDGAGRSRGSRCPTEESSRSTPRQWLLPVPACTRSVTA